ncbi:MAG TPA: hypothetical protein ENJ56_06865, partial [Anaerolineae bacterium]|nr:hypothetical protein [Anaerolineae bacterium]
MQKRWQHYALLVALLIHGGAWLYLARFSLWSDEASSVWFARQSVRDLFVTLCDPHPPLYYIFLHFWLKLGDGEVWLRLPSLLASLATLGVLYRWMGAWFGRKQAQWIVILLALQPVQIWYAAEVRMYAIVQFLTILAAYLAWHSWQNETFKWSDAGLYWLAATAALWVDYTAVFGLGMVQLLWLAYKFPQSKRWILLQLAVGLPTALAWVFSGQLVALGSSYQPLFLAQRLAQLGLTVSLEQAALLLKMGAVVIGVVGVLVALRWQKIVTWRKIHLIAVLLLLIWLILVFASAYPRLFTLKRLLLVLLPWGTLIIVWVIVQLSEMVQRYTIAFLVMTVLLLLGVNQKVGWRSAVQQALLTEDTTAIWVDELVVPAFQYYATPSQRGQIIWLDRLPDLPELAVQQSSLLV